MSGGRKRGADPVIARERGTIFKGAARTVALGYPAPYGVGVSSLGFQQVYRKLNAVPGLSCQRFFLPRTGPIPRPVVTVETGRPVGGMDALLFSIACEQELLGLVRLLEASGLAPLAADRASGDPPVIIGGPLTYVDPELVAPLADAVAITEADDLLAPLGEAIAEGPADLLESLVERCPGLWIPGDTVPPPVRIGCVLPKTPAVAATWSPDAELRDLFLVEASRGCPRHCAFCTMSKKSLRAPRYRVFPAASIIAAIPDDATAVGLVGAAVSEHSEIEALVGTLVESGRRVSLSSLRADRLTPALAARLRQGGLRTMTIAADGPSEALRRSIRKGLRQEHLERAAAVARDAGFKRLRVYAMLGLPGEEDGDVIELAGLLRSLGRGLSVTASVQVIRQARGELRADRAVPVAAE